ncbi:MAG: flagellar biosynthetic protein FliQ [Acidiphilium sp.]|jgi:flagellar biosynthetic protein FliQ|uniref:flagellar biosynthetic protein FliQ n=1 Tax=Acidiphilium acidophilum TaxID=76588 RepID=UPI002A16B569|nr:flagellar biosynthetic protein FliQ [Acidiphilium sp.]MEE3501335.1 flagellar biosynthetic protein FliQ [Acidiphilium acidophilum]
MKLPDWYTSGATLSFIALAGPALAVSLIIGIAGAIIQTTTQIRETAIAFVPKVIGLALLVVFGGGLMLGTLKHYTRHVMAAIPQIIHVHDPQ